MGQKFVVETSARHVHITKEDLETLFGKGYELTVRKELSQPGEFASCEKVTVVGPKRALENVSILGPCRKRTQIELAMTEARSIGINAPVRESGQLDGTPGCILRGPVGEVSLNEGVIIAKRHIHLDPKSAEEAGVTDKQIVGLKTVGGERSVIFGDVVVRVGQAFAPAVHLDTDEANACGGASEGELVL